METISHTLCSSSNEYPLSVKLYPCRNPRALVHVVHGMIDHQGRYIEFIEFLHKHQFLVVSHDHIGHGQSVNTLDDLGSFKSGTWETLVEDVHLVVKYVKDIYDLPYFVVAHSMGSFVLRSYINQYDDLSGIVLSGTMGSATGTQAGIVLAKSLVKLKGRDEHHPVFNQMIFKSYNHHFEQRTAYDWLTRDTVLVDQYVEDPLTSFDFTIGSYYQLFRGISMITSKQATKHVNHQLPILILSGSQDPIGQYGKGLVKLYLNLKKDGFPFVELKLYDGGRHEMLNELNRVEVFSDIVNWIELRLRAM